MDSSHPDFVSPYKFGAVNRKLREHYYNCGLTEVNAQTCRSILSACEDPKTLTQYEFEGQNWPLPQTGQMVLEVQIMSEFPKNPDLKGFFCDTTSYRQEPNPIPGRHNKQFRMSEVELPCNFRGLINFQRGLLKHLGYDESKFVEVTYEDMCKQFNTEFIEHEHEQKIYETYGPTVWLMHFPSRTHPYWNMKKFDGSDHFYKADLLLSGMEVIGGAERSTDVDTMRQEFYRNSDGMYAKTLFEKFGQDRVTKELDDFFGLQFFTRSGMGIGMNRLIRSMTLEGLLDDQGNLTVEQ